MCLGVGRAFSARALCPHSAVRLSLLPTSVLLLHPRPVRSKVPPPSSSLTVLPRINGHPGNSVRLAGLWKLEEVSPSWTHCRSVPQLPPSLPPRPPHPTALPPAPDFPPLAPAVPSQRLHDGPVPADGHHHGSETDAEQLRGVPGPVRTVLLPQGLPGAPSPQGALEPTGPPSRPVSTSPRPVSTSPRPGSEGPLRPQHPSLFHTSPRHPSGGFLTNVA